MNPAINRPGELLLMTFWKFSFVALWAAVSFFFTFFEELSSVVSIKDWWAIEETFKGIGRERILIRFVGMIIILMLDHIQNLNFSSNHHTKETRDRISTLFTLCMIFFFVIGALIPDKDSNLVNLSICMAGGVFVAKFLTISKGHKAVMMAKP